MSKKIFALGVLLMFTTIVEIKANFWDDVFGKIEDFFQEAFTSKNFDKIVNKVDEQVNNLGRKLENIDTDDLKNKIENAFNKAKENIAEIDPKKLLAKVEKFIQDERALDDAFGAIGSVFKGDFSADDFDIIKNKIGEQIGNLGYKLENIDTDVLMRKVENLFNEAKKNVNEIDPKELKTKVERFIQDEKAWDDTLSEIRDFFEETFTADNFEKVRREVEKQISTLGSKIENFDATGLKNKVEHLFNEKNVNEMNRVQFKAMALKVEELVQEAKAEADGNSSATPLKFSFFTIIMTFFYIYLVC